MRPLGKKVKRSFGRVTMYFSFRGVLGHSRSKARPSERRSQRGKNGGVCRERFYWTWGSYFRTCRYRRGVRINPCRAKEMHWKAHRTRKRERRIREMKTCLHRRTVVMYKSEYSLRREETTPPQRLTSPISRRKGTVKGKNPITKTWATAEWTSTNSKAPTLSSIRRFGCSPKKQGVTEKEVEDERKTEGPVQKRELACKTR